jgi:hypothetical protein
MLRGPSGRSLFKSGKEPDAEQEGRCFLVTSQNDRTIEGPAYLKGWDDYLATSISFFCTITFSSVSYYVFMLHDG